MAGLEDVKELRARTGAGVLDCKKALTENDGDIEKAIDWLRTKGLAIAAKKSARTTTEGLVFAYIHGQGRIGVLVEVNCETDFVARTEKFQAFVKEIALQIAAHGPEYISEDEIPQDARLREREIQKARIIEEGKPAAVAERVVDGRMKKWLEEVCLLDQVYFRDESKKIRDLVVEAVAEIKENIKIRRFVRFVLGEGLQKKEVDFAAEVAAQVQH
jgi:elongation factor Ts